MRLTDPFIPSPEWISENCLHRGRTGNAIPATYDSRGQLYCTSCEIERSRAWGWFLTGLVIAGFVNGMAVAIWGIAR